VVEQVSDQEIMESKAIIDGLGIGCEPASAASLAGLKKLVAQGTIQPHETVVGILTGHVLKDPEATVDYHADRLAHVRAVCPNVIHDAEPTVEAIAAILGAGEGV
jgi:threonine synthase